MPSSLKRTIVQQFSKAPSFAEVVGGTVLGIVLTYLGYYAGELFSGTHSLDFTFLGNLLLLGVPVLCIGWYQQYK